MPENELKPRIKKGAKKAVNSDGLIENTDNSKPVKKKSRKKKTAKKIKTKSKRSIRKVPLESKAIEAVEKTVIETSQNIIALPQNIISNPVEKTIELGPTKNQNPIPIIKSNNFFQNTIKKKIFILFSILSFMVFLAGGYVYPATEDDIVKGTVIWDYYGKYDRALFSQFYSSIAFTLGIFLLAYYVTATFIRFNIKNWNYFALGLLLMFFFGLGKIGELVYDHELFDMLKDIILPISLMVLAFASYRIYKDMDGVV